MLNAKKCHIVLLQVVTSERYKKLLSNSYVASFPGSPTPEWEYVYMGRAWYHFSRGHDIIQNRKAAFCALFNQLCTKLVPECLNNS